MLLSLFSLLVLLGNGASSANSISSQQEEEKRSLLSVTPTAFFLSPFGSDSNAGTSPAAAFATLGRAQDAVAALRAGNGGSLPTSVAIWLQSGSYFVNETVSLGPDISGDEVHEVTIASLGLAATISGGVQISKWTPAPGGLLTVELPLDTVSTANVREMWSSGDGSRRTWASTPVLRYAGISYANGTDQPQTLVSVAPGTLPRGANLTGAFIRLYHSWTSSISPVLSWDESSGVLATGPIGDHFDTASGNRFALLGWRNASALAPGSFWFEPEARVLVYRPLPGEDPSAVPLIVPRLATVLSLGGRQANASSPVQWLRNVTLANVTVAHSASALEEAGCLGTTGCCEQSAAELPSAALEVGLARGIGLVGVTVAHTGGYAVWLQEGLQSSLMASCHLHDLGAGGVRIGRNAGGLAPEPPILASDLTLADSVVEDGGHLVQAGAGVLLQQAARVSVVHNAVRDLLYTGVSTGWTWDYGPTSNANLTVGWNAISGIGGGVLSDMGCVYNLGSSPGTAIINNVCSNVSTYGYGGWGYYADQATCGVLFRDNVAVGTTGAGFHQHFGEGNVITNNVFALPVNCDPRVCDNAAVRSSQHPPSRTDPGSNSSFSLLTNIVLLGGANETAYMTTMATGLVNMTIDRNLYWSRTAVLNGSAKAWPPTQAPMTWDAWRAGGHDAHSLLADPLLAGDVAAGNVTLAPGSPAFSLGFTQIDTSGVGPRPPTADVQLAAQRWAAAAAEAAASVDARAHAAAATALRHWLVAVAVAAAQ